MPAAVGEDAARLQRVEGRRVHVDETLVGFAPPEEKNPVALHSEVLMCTSVLATAVAAEMSLRSRS